MLINIHTHIVTGRSFEMVNNPGSHTALPSFSTGIHPQNAQSGAMDELIRSVSHPACLAIGECGLDKAIHVPMDIQLAVFEAQIGLSEQLNLPLILHCVKAWNEVLQVKRKLDPQQRWIFHGFRKTNLLESVLKEGLMISIGTAVLYDQKLQEIVPLIPDDRLFLETDNDPDHSIEEVYAKVAGLKKVSKENLEESIYTNFLNTFPRFKPYF